MIDIDEEEITTVNIYGETFEQDLDDITPESESIDDSDNEMANKFDY